MKSKKMKIIAALFATVFLTIVALPYLVDGDSLRPRLESALQSALGREVHIGYVQVSLLSGGAWVDDISIADDPAFSSGDFLHAKSLNVGISFLSLIFSHSLRVTSLTVNEPRLVAMRSSSGRWNFSTIGSPAANDSFDDADDSPHSRIILDRLRIRNGILVVADSDSSDMHTNALHNINLDLRNASLDSTISFLISARAQRGGEMQIRGEAGPLNRRNPEQTPLHASIKISKMDLAQVAGESSIQGILTGTASLTSNGSMLCSEGNVSADRLAFVKGAEAPSPLIAIRYAANYSFPGRSGTIRTGEVSAGESVARFSGTYQETKKGFTVHLKLSGSQLPLDTVQGLLPAFGIQLPGGSMLHGGTITATLSFDGPMNRIVTSGRAQISDAHLKGFDLGAKLSALPGVGSLAEGSDLSVLSLSSGLRISPEGTHISGLDSQLAGFGGVTGDGDIGPDNSLEFHMIAHVANNGLLRTAFDHLGLKKMPNDVPFKVVGTASKPIILPDGSGIAKAAANFAAKEAAKAAAKQAARSVAKDTVQRLTENTTRTIASTSPRPEFLTRSTNPSAASENSKVAYSQAATDFAASSHKKSKLGGLIHHVNPFGHRDKNKEFK